MHQAAGNLWESGLFGADVTLFQEVEPISLGSALLQQCLHDFQSSGGTSRDVLCLFAIEVNVLSVYAHPLDLIWDGIRISV